jgi:adenosylcobyric acid synthase
MWLREHGLADALITRVARGGPVLGICGGCQMLGATIADPDAVESTAGNVAGLGLLPIRTRFQRDKTLAQVKASPGDPCFLTSGVPRDTVLIGYEIHAGVVEPLPGASAPFRLRERNRGGVDLTDGAVGESGVVVGTLIHGLLENEVVRGALLGNLRARRAVSQREAVPPPSARDPLAEYDRLADVVKANVDWALLQRIVERVRA